MLKVYVFQIANLAGLSVAVVLAESEDHAWQLLNRFDDYEGYEWKLM